MEHIYDDSKIKNFIDESSGLDEVNISDINTVKRLNSMGRNLNNFQQEILSWIKIFEKLPLRGKKFYIEESEREYEFKLHQFFNIPKKTYYEYVFKKEQDIKLREEELGKELWEEEELEEEIIILSESDYNQLTIEDYCNELHIPKPRKTSPYILFAKQHRQIEMLDISRYAGSDNVTYSLIGESLGNKWDCLPFKGKLDY